VSWGKVHLQSQEKLFLFGGIMFLLIRVCWSFGCDVIVCIEFVKIHWLMVSYSMSILLRKRLSLLSEVKVFLVFFSGCQKVVG